MKEVDDMMHAPLPRTLAAAAVLVALLTAACRGGEDGTSPATDTTGTSADDPAMRYAQCMRAHGVPKFPDPVGGRIELRPDSGIDPSSPAYRAADRACAAWSPRGSRGGAAGAANWRELSGWLARQAAARRFSGAVLVAKGDASVFERAVGLANVARRQSNTTRTRFNIGSIGKTFTAVAIAQLVERGKLSFDDRIARYLPEFPYGEITVAQLLTHTSGLGDVFARWHPTDSPLDVSSIMERVATEPLQFDPGARVSYSNSGYVVLGAIVEAVTHQSYYDYVREHVLAPAGMTHTGWYTLDEVPNMAHGYLPVERDGKVVALRDSHGAGGNGNPSGGAYSTVGDLLRFARALLDHRLLGSAMTDTVLAAKVDTPIPGRRYAYGFETETRHGTPVVGHGGGAPGIEAQLRIYPRLGYTAIVLANEDDAATPVYDRIDATLDG